MEATVEPGKFFKVGTSAENSKTMFLLCLHIGALAMQFSTSYLLRNGIYPQHFIFGSFSSAKKSNYVSFDLAFKLESAIIWVLEHRYIVLWVQIETFQFFVSP
jgi:hypothetical protein